MRKNYLFQVRGTNFLLGQRTWIVGVVNVTPDSFFDGGLYLDKERAVERGLDLVSEGADIIDIGGESTRPGSDPVPAGEEMRRVIPVISALRKKTDVFISIDTTKQDVAQAALDAGADIINDISSFRFDPRMLNLAAQNEAGLILMHMKGMPKTMQVDPFYEDLLEEIKSFLKERLEIAQSYGIKKERIIIDPGIGFGKRLEDNLALINNLSFLEELDRPILIGISQKSFIGKILNLPPQERLEGTIASAVLSIVRGAHILRVHDIKTIKRAVLVAEAILNQSHAPNSQEKNKNPYVC